MPRPGPGASRAPFLLLLPLLLAPAGLNGQELPAGASGREIYEGACAACHGVDGAGTEATLVAFEEPLPDFTDCNFASREPDADWVGVAHGGGPMRGFSRMMPAFGDALSPEQLQRAMDYIRGFCGDDAWPRGEMNLPRPFLTEKAYPEDEAVFTSAVAVEGSGEVGNEFVWEQRFGARSQLEIVVPFTLRARDLAGGMEGGGDWIGGLGDVVVGVKRDMWHDNDAGSILSLAGEVKLPTGDETKGFGTGTPVFESFVSFGQILPGGAFLQLQGVVEVPYDQDVAENEGVWRAALGRTFTQGRWGRAWSPMVEVQGKRALESGAETSWDLLPQVQVALNTRQHVLGNIGVLLPVTDSDVRDARLYVYLLWDWFDGGFFEGW